MIEQLHGVVPELRSRTTPCPQSTTPGTDIEVSGMGALTPSAYHSTGLVGDVAFGRFIRILADVASDAVQASGGYAHANNSPT
jgi:hypothetical protein